MSTTLNEARTAALKLSDHFPAPSTYANTLATISDYLDNQVPLIVENRALTQRIAVLEAVIERVRKALPDDPSIVTISAQVNAAPGLSIPRPIDCTAWMGMAAGACECQACRVRANA